MSIAHEQNLTHPAFMSTATDCDCTQTGISGGVDTGVSGCVPWENQEPGPFFPLVRRPGNIQASYICYINGGASANCPCVHNSVNFTGAAYRPCADSLYRAYHDFQVKVSSLRGAQRHRGVHSGNIGALSIVRISGHVGLVEV